VFPPGNLHITAKDPKSRAITGKAHRSDWSLYGYKRKQRRNLTLAGDAGFPRRYLFMGQKINYRGVTRIFTIADHETVTVGALSPI